MFCPKCKSEYREGFTHCPDCDADLVASLPGEEESETENNNIPETESNSIDEAENDDKAFVPVLSTYNLGDIALLRSILDEQGIEYFIQGENTAYIRGYMDPSILMVRNDQVQLVLELLKDFDVKFTMFSAK